MVDADSTTQDRASRIIIRIVVVVLAAATIAGWYFYGTENSSRTELESVLQKLEEDRATLQQDLNRERQSRQQTQDSLQAQIEALEAEKAAAAELESSLQQSQQERERLETELQGQLAQQQSLNEKIGTANADRDELSARLEQAQNRRQQLLDQIAGVNDDIESKEAALAVATNSVQQLNSELDQARQEQDRLETRVAELSEQQQQEAAHFEALRLRLEQDLDESRVEITQLKNRMTVIKLTSEVLFNSGSADIKPAGRKVLDLIATSLNAYPERAISIEGHTDNVPIGKNINYVSNWDLSAARALAAVDHLQRQAQVAPQRLRVVGHGEFKPVASNDTASGRQLNRRIEIRLLAEPDQ